MSAHAVDVGVDLTVGRRWLDALDEGRLDRVDDPVALAVREPRIGVERIGRQFVGERGERVVVVAAADVRDQPALPESPVDGVGLDSIAGATDGGVGVRRPDGAVVAVVAEHGDGHLVQRLDPLAQPGDDPVERRP